MYFLLYECVNVRTYAILLDSVDTVLFFFILGVIGRLCFNSLCLGQAMFSTYGVIGGYVFPASILRKSTSGRHRPVSYPDGPMTARYRFT